MKPAGVIIIFLTLTFFWFSASGLAPKPVKVLIYSKTSGFRHKNIPLGIKAIRELGKEIGFSVDTTENPEDFNSRNLKQYKAVIFLSPTGNDILNSEQRTAFQKYIRSGGGFAGIHAATDCLFDWEWYSKMVGGYFKNHPKIQEAHLHIKDDDHSSTRALPKEWVHTDEWYNFKNLNSEVKVLITVDEKTYSGGTNGENHPIAWYHEFEGGRVFYTALGHTDDCFTKDKLFLNHLAGGIKYAAGIR